MNVAVHIGRLNVEGVALTRREREALGPDVQSDLQLLLAGAQPSTGMSAQIARAVHAQLLPRLPGSRP